MKNNEWDNPDDGNDDEWLEDEVISSSEKANNFIDACLKIAKEDVCFSAGARPLPDFIAAVEYAMLHHEIHEQDDVQLVLSTLEIKQILLTLRLYTEEAGLCIARILRLSGSHTLAYRSWDTECTFREICALTTAIKHLREES